MKFFVSAAHCLALASLIILAGCSDKNGGGPPNNPYTKTPGDLDDEVFQTAFIRFQWSVQYGQGMLDDVFEMVDSLPASGGAAQDIEADTAEWHAGSKFWVRDYTDQQSSGASYRYIDSVQFLHGTEAVKEPDAALLTSLRIISRHALTYMESDDSLAIGLNVTISGSAGAIGNRGYASLTGTGYLHSLLTGHDHTDARNEDCALAFDFTSKYEDVRLNIADVFYGAGCPSSGKVRHIGYMTTSCIPAADSMDYQKQWTCIAVYDGVRTRLEIEDPAYRWIFEIPCDQYSVPPTDRQEQALQLTRDR